METLEKNQIEINGTFQRFRANKHGDLDALELTNEQGAYKINFSPHTAKIIMAAVKQGEYITLTCKEEKPKHDSKGDKKDKLKLQFLATATNKGILVSNIHPEKTEINQFPEILQFENFELLEGKKGELIGIRSSKQLVHIHKEDQEFADKIKPSSKIRIFAIKRTNDGFINENQDDVYHIEKIEIDGNEYSTKRSK